MAESDSAIAEPSLWHLAYSSAASEGFTLSDLEDVLNVARERNTRDDISGILLFEGTSFLQVLEGDQERIDALLESIRRDPRHKHAVLLLREQVEQRSFADWSMGYTAVKLGHINTAIGVNDFFGDHGSFTDLDSAKVRRLLELFRSGSYRQKLR
jgi:Sensors of blue-light using FAD